MQQHVTQDRDASETWKRIWRAFWSGYKSGAGPKIEQLFDGDELADVGVHIGTEILMRTFGPFKEGYVYQSFDKTHPILTEAKEMTIKFIIEPKYTIEEFGL